MRVKVWILRYVKFNIIGFAGFLLGSAIYSASFDAIGSWAWIAANGIGGVLQFLLIGYFNTKKKGKMFDSCA